MPQDHPTPEDNYRRFIEQVRESGEVWGLRADQDWAFCESNEYENTDVIVFWSDKASAQQHAQGDWEKHQPTAIPLEDFINQWLQGMDEDGALVGPNWGLDLDGLEIEPQDLAEELDGEAADD